MIRNRLRTVSTGLQIAAVIAALAGSPIAATIDFWQFWTDPQIRPTIDSIAREFEQAHPGTTVRITDLTWANGQEKIAIAFASGTGPDVVELGADWLAQFADAKQLLDLSGELSRDSADYTGWQLSTYQSAIYAMPWILGTRVIFGNRELMLKSTVYDSVFVPVAWEQLRVAAYYTGRVASGVKGWGSNVPEKHRLYKKFLPFFWSGGGQLFSDDGKYCLLASDHGIEALRLLQQMHDTSGLVGDQRTIEDAFVAGRLGFVMSGEWLVKRITKENPALPYFTTMVPGREFPGKSILGGELLAINAATKQKELAVAFVRHCNSPANQLRFCKAAFSAGPSNKLTQADPFFTSNPNLLIFIKQMKNAVAPPVDPLWPRYEEIIEAAVEKAIFQNGKAGDVLYEAKQQIEAVRARRNK